MRRYSTGGCAMPVPRSETTVGAVDGFAQWTRSVAPADLDIPARSIPISPAIGTLTDPDGAVVARDSDEPLVIPCHPRLSMIPAYSRAGWTAAHPTVLVRSSVADRLYAVAEDLPSPWGLHIYDAWRPVELQAELFDAAYANPDLPPGFLAPPSTDPRTPPPHLTGGSVDLTLSWRGIPLSLGTPFDAFWDSAHTAALEDLDDVNRNARRWLVALMRSAGFIVLHCEWWHFEFGTRRWAAITGHDAMYGATMPPQQITN